MSQETGTLFIRNVSAMADEGAYHCMLENTAGGVNSTEARLTIRDAESKRKYIYEHITQGQIQDVVCWVRPSWPGSYQPCSAQLLWVWFRT